MRTNGAVLLSVAVLLSIPVRVFCDDPYGCVTVKVDCAQSSLAGKGVFLGKVGITTNAPDAKLTLAGWTEDTDIIAAYLPNKEGGFSIRHRKTGTDYLRFYVMNESYALTHIMSLQADGGARLGIGTTSPSETLHVAGDGKIDGEATIKRVPGDGLPMGVYTNMP